MPAPTWYSAARVNSPFSISEAFAVVPPMSNEIALSMPMRRASSRTPTTPAAGPDSMMCIGVAAAASAVVSPPFDCISKSGAVDAAAPQPAAQPAQIALDDRPDIGVDDRRRCPLVFVDDRQHLGADRERDIGRQPRRDLLDPDLMRRVQIRVQQADRDRLDPLADQKPHRALDARLVERPVDAALGVDPLVDLDPQAALDERRRLGPRHVVEPRHPQIADFEHVAETPAS